eukprot:CAMPEP_0174985254 /NCGR_PEP_ID=MMETSP0004_2-20121128/18235_1 /TAXON_ID=420556 /ORGANISM="Ochromonas sp., Strain CCMP1393" /LENGTH=114 /DNA_ID=CAMNT_0016237873 /DNA_START=153 /DNA_END=494 /DNA_ORIENTATION=+
MPYNRLRSERKGGVVKVDLQATVSITEESHGEVGNGQVVIDILEQLVTHHNTVLLASDDTGNVEVSAGPRLDGETTILSVLGVTTNEVGQSTLLVTTEGLERKREENTFTLAYW